MPSRNKRSSPPEYLPPFLFESTHFFHPFPFSRDTEKKKRKKKKQVNKKRGPQFQSRFTIYGFPVSRLPSALNLPFCKPPFYIWDLGPRWIQ